VAWLVEATGTEVFTGAGAGAAVVRGGAAVVRAGVGGAATVLTGAATAAVDEGGADVKADDTDDADVLAGGAKIGPALVLGATDNDSLAPVSTGAAARSWARANDDSIRPTNSPVTEMRATHRATPALKARSITGFAARRRDWRRCVAIRLLGIATRGDEWRPGQFPRL
jgi:hypothetical protein